MDLPPPPTLGHGMHSRCPLGWESILTLVPYIPVNRTCKHFDQQMLYYLCEIVSQAPFLHQKPILFRFFFLWDNQVVWTCLHYTYIVRWSKLLIFGLYNTRQQRWRSSWVTVSQYKVLWQFRSLVVEASKNLLGLRLGLTNQVPVQHSIGSAPSLPHKILNQIRRIWGV